MEFCVTLCVRVPTKVNTPTQEKLGWGTRRWIHLAAHGPSQRKKCAGMARRVYIGAVGSQNGHSNVRISYMAASKRSRRAQAPINILLCAALFVASFVVYWTGLSVYEQMLRPSRTEVFDALVHRTFPSSPRSTPDPYATPESANIDRPAVHLRTSYALDGTSPPLATLDSYATPGFNSRRRKEGWRDHQGKEGSDPEPSRSTDSERGVAKGYLAT